MPNRPVIEFLGDYQPTLATPGSACYDLRATVRTVLHKGAVVKVPTGLKVSFDSSHFMAILSRSGLASRGIIVANAPGVIDSDYRGEIQVILANISTETFQILQGDRIAQAMLLPVTHPIWRPTDDLDDTERGAGGLGSTGL